MPEGRDEHWELETDHEDHPGEAQNADLPLSFIDPRPRGSLTHSV